MDSEPQRPKNWGVLLLQGGLALLLCLVLSLQLLIWASVLLGTPQDRINLMGVAVLVAPTLLLSGLLLASLLCSPQRGVSQSGRRSLTWLAATTMLTQAVMVFFLG